MMLLAGLSCLRFDKGNSNQCQVNWEGDGSQLHIDLFNVECL